MVLRDELERAFHRLTDDQRAVLVLLYYRDMTVAQVADVLRNLHRHREVPALPRAQCDACRRRGPSAASPAGRTDGMIRDAEFDRLLTGWLSDGPERAPAGDVAAALAIVATTPQRRRWTAASQWREWMRSPLQTRLSLILAVLLLVLAAVAIGVGARLIQWPSPTQDTTPLWPSATSLRPVQIEDRRAIGPESLDGD